MAEMGGRLAGALRTAGQREWAYEEVKIESQEPAYVTEVTTRVR